MKTKNGFLSILLLLVIWSALSSWGFLVHRTQVQLALYELPSAMRPFFYAEKEALVKEVIQPDLRRGSDSSEIPRHFIDLENYGDSAAWKMPENWLDAVRLYSLRSLQKEGYVPYEVIRVKRLLTGAFQQKNTDSIVYYAADLAHYIGDAHVPLHTTNNYDGQLSQQKGIHSLWETSIPELELNQYYLSSRHKAVYLQNPEQRIWQAIRDAHNLLPALFGKEKELDSAFPDSIKYSTQQRKGKPSRIYSTAFAYRYSESLGNSINRQLLLAVDCIADFWYTAWVDAGKPSLNAMLQQKDDLVDKKRLKLERRAFKHNELLQKNFLISRKLGQANTE